MVLDATIIKPLIESVTGEDMITGEDLSEFEKGMKLASGVVSLFTLGQGGVIINGGRVAFQSTLVTMGKMVAIDMVTTGVTYGTSELCQKMGMPGSVTMLLSMLAGGKVGSTLNNKWLANLSAEDAARFWKNLEPGEKLPPGMTGDEYAKYLKGLGRVDDAAALGKVDYDEVLRVRKEGVGGVEMPEIISKFNYKSKYDEVEFATQLKNQEKGLNDLTISEFVENRRNYNELGRSKKATNLQKELREQFKQDKIEELLKTGSSYEDAVNEAEKWMKTQAVLHDPDQIAGGNPMNLNGLGDKNINSSIGSQWRYRIDDLEKQIMDFANTIPKGEWGNVKLNIKLTY